jgi:hypothetical protein
MMTFFHPEIILREQTALRMKQQNALVQVVTAGFALTAATQILVTTLLAAKIYAAMLTLRQLSNKPTSRYSAIMWTLVESGML